MQEFKIASASAQVLYERLARSFAVQGYRVERQAPNERLRVKLERVPIIVYWSAALVFFVPQLVILITALSSPIYSDGYFGPATALCGLPTAMLGVAWLLWAMPSQVTLHIKEAGTDTAIAADVSGLRAKDLLKRLEGNLAMIA